MQNLELRTFNGFRVLLAGEQIRAFRSIKERALLAYLAVEPRTHSRPFLAGLLWPDEPEKKARRNLSQTLLNLRKAIADHETNNVFELSSKHIALQITQRNITDVTQFQTLRLETQNHTHKDFKTCAICTANLQSAADLYVGPFLEGFYVPETDAFEDWLISTRESLEQDAIELFVSLSECYETQGDLSRAQKVIRRVLDLTPWQESAHRQLMRLLALSGMRSQAINHYERYKELLEQELAVGPSQETIELYQQIVSGKLRKEKLESEEATARRLLSVPFQVSPSPPHFVGRETEKKILYEGLLEPASVVAIVGMGGIGKSSLATQLAHDSRDAFPDGVLWANTATTSTMDILDMWAKAFDEDVSSLADSASRALALSTKLAGKKVLIILDNVDEASRAKHLIAAGSMSSFLITTRDLEVAYALNATALQLNELSSKDSRQLLIKILGEERIENEEAAAQEICERLNDLPLAVEIAAQRLKSRTRMSLKSMAERLKTTQSRLSLEISDIAVRTSFELSWNALDSEHKTVFPLLAVFEGRSFNAKAVAAIAGINKESADDYLYTLTALSLVKEEGQIYYKQHPLLADFAKEKLADPFFHQNRLISNLTKEKLGQVTEVYERMANYYVTLTEEADKQLTQEDTENWRYILELDYPNIHAAISWALSSERLSLSERALLSLNQYWELKGIWGEALDYYEMFFALLPDLLSENQMQLYTNYAYAQYRLGNLTKAEESSRFMLKQPEHLEFRGWRAKALNILGMLADDYGQYETSLEYHGQSLAIYVELNDLSGQASNLHNMSTAARNLGRYDDSLAYSEQGLELFKSEGDADFLFYTYGALGELAHGMQDFDKAQEYYEKSFAICQKRGAIWQIAGAYNIFASLAFSRENFNEAKYYVEQALEIAESINNKPLLADTHLILADVANACKANQEALRHFRFALQLFRDLEDLKQECLEVIESFAHHLCSAQIHLPEAALLLYATRTVRGHKRLLRRRHLFDLQPSWQILKQGLNASELKQIQKRASDYTMPELFDLCNVLVETLVDYASSAS